MKHHLVIAALVATSMSAIALPALAQDPAPVASKWGNREVHRSLHDGGRMGRGPGGLFNLVCSDRGAERLEIGFVRLSHRLDLTDAQKPLFDALKATALTTQTSFADECKTAQPAKSATKPDMLERLKSGIKRDEARLTAMNAVLPDLEAFYASLTDEQKASLTPRRDDRLGRGMRGDNDKGPRFQPRHR